MMPHRTPFFLPLAFPSLLWRMPSGSKQVYLTFDDGPVAGPTEFVLDELRRFNVRATFFCIGDNVRKQPDIFRRIVSEGHAIGNHTFHHVNGWRTGTAEYLKNIALNDEQMSREGCRAAGLFRPPYGRITPWQIRALKQYRIVMWDVLSRDFDQTLVPGLCLDNTLKAVRPGSIVVFHDSHKAERNLRFTLPRLLERLSEEGYSFSALTS